MLANACRKKIERDNRGNLLSRLFFNLGCGICLSNHIPSDPLESALLIKKKMVSFFSHLHRRESVSMVLRENGISVM